MTVERPNGNAGVVSSICLEIVAGYVDLGVICEEVIGICGKRLSSSEQGEGGGRNIGG